MNKCVSALFLAVSLAACGNDAPGTPGNVANAQAQKSACELLTSEQVQEASGIAIINVSAQDRGVFTSCSFETDDWTQTIGLIYFPGLGTPASAASLAEQVKADLERDEVEYSSLEPDESIGDAAVRYQAEDGSMHWVVAHRGGNRIIINATTAEAATTLARLALDATE